MGNKPKQGIDRRLITAGLASAATLAALSHASSKRPTESITTDETTMNNNHTKMPVVFLPHGGGPWPFADLGMSTTETNELLAYLRSIPTITKEKPKALLVISAHWEETTPTVMTAANPPMFYDYYGFPADTYKLNWPAPNHRGVAARVVELLNAAGFQPKQNEKRGFDHGTFVPMMVAFPDADIPTVQLSLKVGLDPKEHLAIGAALVPLRDEGVLILGSGMSYHNMRGFRDRSAHPIAETFDAWLRETTSLEATERDQRLANWTQAPAARLAHPREEHLLPLMVIAGAAGADRGKTAYNGSVWGIRLSAFHFG